MPRYDHVARAVFDTPWFIRENEGSVITALVRGRLNGERLEADEITQRVQAARAAQGPRSGSVSSGPVAVIPVYGVLMQRANIMTEMSGGTSVEAVRAALDESLRDKDIAAVILEFDSPGGEVYGIDELATWMREQRGTKPMVAVVNTLCCSAAYYLAAQCDEIVATPSSITGSIGVFMEHVEFSKAEEAAGVVTTIVRMPEAKHDINNSEPLSDAGMTHLQSIVDDYYGQFIAAVAKGRGVGQAQVRDGYAQGRELTAARAKTAGLVDRIDTLDNTIRRLASGRGRAAMAPAATHGIELEPGQGYAVVPADTMSNTITITKEVLGAGLPFSQRASLVSASAMALLEHAREHVAMRASSGRSISGDTREQLVATAETFRGIAAELDQVVEPMPEPEPEPPVPGANRVLLLELEAALVSGGYTTSN